MTVPERNAFIVNSLLPTVIGWGFTEEDLTRAITKLSLPKSFTIWNPRHIQIIPDVRHRQKMLDRGETMTHAAVLDTKTSPAGTVLPKSSHVFVFATMVDKAPALRADWQTLPETQSDRPSRTMYTPKLPNIDPGHGGHTADIGARRLQRLLNRE